MGATLLSVLLGTLYVSDVAVTPCGALSAAQAPRLLSAFRLAAHDAPSASTAKVAKGKLLVASRSLGDPNFSETVILLLAYEAHGAMGIIINRPTDVPLASVVTEVPVLRKRSERVFVGGPVGGNLMVFLLRSARRPRPSEPIFGDVYATGSLKALDQALSKSAKSTKLRAYAGYAGWGPGQLDMEIARGDWYVTAAEAATVFDTPPADIWPKLIERSAGQWTRAHAGGVAGNEAFGWRRTLVALN